MLAADSGADRLRFLEIVPDVAVGDFDSMTPDTLAWLKDRRVELKLFPQAKDKTDAELAIEEAATRGANELTLTCAWGGRIDQTLANIFLLRSAHKKGLSCRISEAAGDVYLVERRLTMTGRPGDTVSLLAIEDSTGVVLSGFTYQVPGGRLATGATLGISNILLGREGRIELQSGLILVVHLRGDDERPRFSPDDRRV